MPDIYCVKCRAMRKVTEMAHVVLRNGKEAIQTLCPVCGTDIYRIISGPFWEAVPLSAAYRADTGVFQREADRPTAEEQIHAVRQYNLYVQAEYYLRLRLQTLESQRSTLEKDVAGLKATARDKAAAEQELQDLTTAVQLARQELGVVEEQVADLSAERHAVRVDVDQARQWCAYLDRAIAQLQARRDDLLLETADLENAQVGLVNARAALADIGRQVQILRLEEARLLAKVRDAQDWDLRLVRALEDLEQEMSALQEETRRLQANRDALERLGREAQEVESGLALAREALAARASELARKQEALAGVRVETDQARQELETLQAQRTDAQQDALSLQQRRDGLEREVRDLQARRQAAQADIEQAQLWEQQLKEQLSHMEAQRDDMRAAAAEKQALEADIASLRATSEHLRQQVDALEARRAEVAALRQQAERIRAELEGLRSEHVRLSGALDYMRAQESVLRERARGAQDLEARPAALQAEIEARERQLADLADRPVLAAQVAALREQLAQSLGHENDLRQRIREVEASRDVLQQRLLTAESAPRARSAFDDDWEQPRAQRALEQTVRDLERRKVELEARLVAVEKVSQDLTALGLSMDAIPAVVRRVQETASRNNISVREAMERLASATPDKSAAATDSAVQARREELLALERQIAQRRTESSTVFDSMDKLQEEKKRLEDMLADLRNSIQTQLSSASEEAAASMRNSASLLRKELDDLLEETMGIAGKAAEIDADMRSKQWLSRLLALVEGGESVVASEVRTLAIILLEAIEEWLRRHPDASPARATDDIQGLLTKFNMWRN